MPATIHQSIIFMGSLLLDYVVMITNTGTYYQAIFLKDANQSKDTTFLNTLYSHFHACSMNSTCSYIAKDKTNQLNLYNSRVEIPAEETLLGIWKKTQRHYEYRVFLQMRSWHEAREICQLYGGDLASITSAQDEEKIKQLLSAFVNDEGFWFGLNDIETEGKFVWSDGSEYKYARWRWGEPNNVGNEDCMISGLVMTWVDAGCEGKAYFVCRIAII